MPYNYSYLRDFVKGWQLYSTNLLYFIINMQPAKQVYAGFTWQFFFYLTFLICILWLANCKCSSSNLYCKCPFSAFKFKRLFAPKLCICQCQKQKRLQRLPKATQFQHAELQVLNDIEKPVNPSNPLKNEVFWEQIKLMFICKFHKTSNTLEKMYQSKPTFKHQ